MKDSKLICGIGINDKSRPAWIGDNNTKQYIIWKNMIKRCYDKKCLIRRPDYIGCSVSDNFKHYSYFYDWVSEQIGFGFYGYSLDKDVLIQNNKIYSEDTCAFIPSEINSFFTNTSLSRGLWPIGVYFNEQRSKFMAYCSVNGKDKYLGYFATPEEAHAVYKQFKENLCKELANKWRGKIDERVYNAMMFWSV